MTAVLINPFDGLTGVDRPPRSFVGGANCRRITGDCRRGRLTPHDLLVAGIEVDAERWPCDRFDESAVLCGVCGTELRVRAYLDCDHQCPS